MPNRSQSANPLVTNQIYHLYNRGVAKQEIFLKPYYYHRFERTLQYYSTPQEMKLSRYLSLSQNTRSQLLNNKLFSEKRLEIISYCLMPNHFHLLVKQLIDGGISDFMRLVCNSYTRYFNTMSNRVGSILQGRFKAKLVATNEYLIQVSRYIHVNPTSAGLVTLENLPNYTYSSFPSFVYPEIATNISLESKLLTSLFGSLKKYVDYCLNTDDYAQTLPEIEDLLIDCD